MLNTLDEIHKAYSEFLNKKLLEKMTGEAQVEGWEAYHEHNLKLMIELNQRIAELGKIIKAFCDYQELFEANLKCSDSTWKDIKNLFEQANQILAEVYIK